MKQQLAGQLELFTPPIRPATKPRAPKGITWALRHVRNREACEHCIADVIALGHLATRPLQATWRRTANGLHTYLCSAHAQDQRERDALTRGN